MVVISNDISPPEFFLLLAAAGIAYEEMLVEGEGYGFYKVENNVALFGRVIEFMHQHTSTD